MLIVVYFTLILIGSNTCTCTYYNTRAIINTGHKRDPYGGNYGWQEATRSKHRKDTHVHTYNIHANRYIHAQTREKPVLVMMDILEQHAYHTDSALLQSQVSPSVNPSQHTQVT